MMAPSPIALPSDCWLGILEYLSPADYWSLLFVSKSSSSLIEPFLFREIAWEWHPIPIRRILLLFRAILQKPERASHVRHLSLLSYQVISTAATWEPPICETDCQGELAKFKDVLQHARATVKTAAFPDGDGWTSALESGNPYAFVSILLSQLHNLQSLRLDYSFVWQSGFPGLMLRHALSSPSLSKFDSLTDVDYGANVRRDEVCRGLPEIHDLPGYPECNPEQFPAWFYLPSLRSLKMWLRTKEGIELPDQPRPDLSRLQRLILARTTIPETQVPNILPLAPNLKTLHLGMTYRWEKEVALQNGPSIIQGLQSIKESLTNLSFGVEYYPPTMSDVYFQDGEEDLSIPFYGLLTHFPNLRSVEVPVNLLAGWSTEPSADLASGLPASVEQLCLRADYAPVDIEGWHEEEILDMLAYNVSKLRLHLPVLERVCVRKWVQFWNTKLMEQKIDEVRAAFGKEQIRFEFISDFVSNGIWTENRMCPEREIS